ncbi:Putative ribosomal N-acetyltransferase YdaF [Aquicella siphonis]|uniref:Ribosomal N-acetyltransferase YdaF n=1 Tax=Aquicella siphonis TaxID=254247 RepID=A0A5E4PGE2_9COXI|nr:GNAT family N-acetyltransferase [Aquicella siphonis]VVC75371.1 Putative ribosomal N-acetyltransferase YdaF [Aquicella siphonis]
MNDKLSLFLLQQNDIDEIIPAFKAIGWHKPKNLYDMYLSEQSRNIRLVYVAKKEGRFCGYVTLKWESGYPHFRQNRTPEICDLNVLPDYRRQGIATRLIKKCEFHALKNGYAAIGIGVGLTADYGDAQKLYVNLGYIPDGNGLHSHQQPVPYNHQIMVDDELILYFKKSLLNADEIELDIPVPIETPRLILRPPQIGDGKKLNEAILESFETLNKFMLWAKDRPALEESEDVVRRESSNWIYRKKHDDELMIMIFSKNTNDFVGATGFHHVDWDVPCAETGYWIRRKYAGQGYMTEAVNAVTRYAFEALRLKRLAITCDVDNERSKKVPERLGYRLESRMKFNRIKPATGMASDTLVYVRNDLNDLPDLKVTWI